MNSFVHSKNGNSKREKEKDLFYRACVLVKVLPKTKQKQTKTKQKTND
jgi:hypothetical protein